MSEQQKCSPCYADHRPSLESLGLPHISRIKSAAYDRTCLPLSTWKRAQPLEKLAAEPLERQVDDLAAELASQPPPGRRRDPAG